MQIDSAQLAAFAAVLREGSFEAAARALHVTPSAVSQRIKALEERLGRVLIRRGVPCVATEAGQSLHRHALQVQLLEAEALAPFGLGGDGRAGAGHRTAPAATPLALAVNADSLATWFVPALAAVQASHGARFDLHVEDQDHSGRLLREGRVIAAVMADAHPVQGCRVLPLGAMRYRALASPAFVARWFPRGIDESALAAAPMLVFNEKDGLQHQFMGRLGSPRWQRLRPPQHRVPSTHGFVHATLHGLGWGLSPQALVAPLLAGGDLVEIAPGQAMDVPLYWQHWRLDAGLLHALTAAVEAAARTGLAV